MKKLAFLLLNLSLWRPGAALMRQLRFPAKMLLISAAFLLPMTSLLVAFVNTKWEELDIVAQERQGVRYASEVFSVLDSATAWRQKAEGTAAGNNGAQVDQARRHFEAEYQKLQALDAELGAAQKTAPALKQVDQAWQAAQGSATHEAMAGLARALLALLNQTTDGSALALDPEIASYHLMSAVLMHGPQVIESTAELRSLGASALETGKLTLEERASLFEYLAVMRHEKDLAAFALKKVQETAPAFAGELMSIAPQTTASFEALVRKSFSGEIAGASLGERDSFVQAADQTLQTQFAQVQKNLQVLDNMLAGRQLRLEHKLWLALLLTLAGLLVATYLFVGFYRSMTGGFKLFRRHLISIAMGDLRGSVSGQGRDEMAGLLKELANMQAALRETVEQVQHASATVVGSSIDIADITRDLSSRTESAASALEESSAALEQTTSTVKITATSVSQASEIAMNNAQTAARGGLVMDDVIETMESIHDSSRKITDIIGVIDGIAFQTNILALNAAVEAARAGDQGRGFAVVASEVRSLAGRCAAAAHEIKSLISSSVQKVESGTDIVRRAGTTMKEIVDNADHIKQLLDEVTHGAHEQSIGISQIGEAVQELDRNTQANAVLVEKTAAAANVQRDAAVRMAAQVDEFRLPGTRNTTLVEGVNVDEMIDTHRQWKVKLRDAIETGETVDVKTLSRDDCCALGKWIYGATTEHLKGRATFVELIDNHAHFHQVAGRVGELINQQRYHDAEESLAHGTAFSKATSAVVFTLSSAKRIGF